MAAPPDDSMVNAEPADTPGGRVRSARFVLLAAVAVLLFAVAVYGLPLAYAAAGMALILFVAAVVPLRSAVRRADPAAARRAALAAPDVAMTATVEAFPKPAFLLDAAGAVRYANRHATLLFPATRPGGLFTLTFRKPEFTAALELAGAGQAAQLEFREPGETAVSYEVTIGPLRSPGGGVNFLLVTFDDVSDRLAVARMRSDFVANASHELRTPLASLTGFIETLLGPARNDPEATERFLNVMLEQARRMRRLIDDLLSLSRAEMRAHSRPTGETDLVGVVRHVADAMRPLAEEQSVTIAVEAPDVPVPVTGDRDELVQVLQNLVENAIRYGGSGERVDVLLEPPAAGIVRLRVRDYGPGIAPEHVPRLTERFYRIDAGESRARNGTGLGLAIIKHILTRHRGSLAIESEPGAGATFTVELPLAAESAGLAEGKHVESIA